MTHTQSDTHARRRRERWLPCFEADQSVLDSRLMVLDHVLVHSRVVLADVPLRGAVRDRAEAEGGRVSVRVLELRCGRDKGRDERRQGEGEAETGGQSEAVE